MSIIERSWTIIKDMATVMLLHCGVAEGFWEEATLYAVSIYNLVTLTDAVFFFENARRDTFTWWLPSVRKQGLRVYPSPWECSQESLVENYVQEECVRQYKGSSTLSSSYYTLRWRGKSVVCHEKSLCWEVSSGASNSSKSGSDYEGWLVATRYDETMVYVEDVNRMTVVVFL